MSIIRDGLQKADLDFPVVLPTLNLDFANSQSLDERITFTRGSVGTFVNKNGLIETAAANQPRFDYDPISGECRGLLIEESRENLLTYSNTFTNSAWNGSSVTRTDNVTTSPDGTTNAALISNSGTTYGGILRQYYTFSAVPYTLSCFVKKINWRYIGIRIADSLASGTFYPVFDLDTQTFITNSVTGITLSYQAFPNGWYRIALTYTPTAGFAVVDIALVPANGDHGSRQGQNVYSAYVYGAQLEARAFPTSYIPTEAATLTRSADVASMTGTNFSSWYNSSEGTLFANAISNSNTTHIPGIAALNVGDGTYRVDLRFYQGGNSYTFFNGEGGGGSSLAGNSLARTSGFLLTNPKYIVSYQTKYVNFAVNASLTFTNTSNFVPYSGINTLRIGEVDSGSLYCLNGTIKRLTYYPKALPPAQLQYLTQ